MPASSTKPQACGASGQWLAVPLLGATASQRPPAGTPVTFLVVLVCACSVAKSCPPLCDPMDCSPSGSSVQRISQARVLEWVAISFSRESSTQGLNPHPLHWQADSLLLWHLESPTSLVMVPVLSSSSCPTAQHPTSVLSWDHLPSQQLDLEFSPQKQLLEETKP